MTAERYVRDDHSAGQHDDEAVPGCPVCDDLMSSDKPDDYNGWKNYPTWAVNLWIGELDAADDAARAAASADTHALRSWVEDVMGPSAMPYLMGEPPSMAADLLGWALDMVDWDELKRHYDPELYAQERGAENGRAAASWVFDGNTTTETYRAILRGIDDGDPAVLDQLPTADLSGQMADTLTGPELVEDAAGYVGLSEEAARDWFTEICDAYETGYDQAVTDELTRVARLQLEEAEA